MRFAVIVPFLDEEHHLDALLSSIASQTRPPERLLLVDDGSKDRSPQIAERFAGAHAYASALRLPARDRGPDRLVAAGEYRAFQWALERLDDDFDVIAKLDADLELTPETLATVERALRSDPGLGITGAFLSVADATGVKVRERCPPYHVRGATKFYRRDCLQDISPVPAILGWDTIDEVTARLHGWRTKSLDVPGGDPLHMRPTGAGDGSLRAFRRWGAAAWASGFHPLWMSLSTARRVTDRPALLGAGHYVAGWIWAAARHQPRARPEVRAHLRREQLERIFRGRHDRIFRSGPG